MGRPISPLKLAANRANAKKSTGPRTPEGKRRSSQNARRHPIMSREVVVRGGNGSERASNYARLRDELQADLRPRDPTEQILVDRIASCVWRLRRAHRYEANAIRKQLAAYEARCDDRSRPDQDADIASAGRRSSRGQIDPVVTMLATLPHERELDKLIRYESMLDRELHRAIDHLRRLREPPAPCKGFSGTGHSAVARPGSPSQSTIDNLSLTRSVKDRQSTMPP